MTRLTIDPVTRLEGHGKIEILLDEAGDVAHTYFQIPELRGFEAFCVGRPVEDMPALTNRICGVCPEAHHMAAAKAADAVYKVTPPPAGRKLRELLYNAFYVTDHATHFYVLSGPDLIMGPDAPAAERNILGVVKKVGAEVGKQVIDLRHAGHRVIEIIGGRRIHPCTGVPGGMTKAISEDERQEIEALGQQMIDFAGFSLDLFDKMFAEDGSIEELVTGDLYRHETYYAGLVDANDKVTFYDGRVKVVAPDGEVFGSYEPKDYRDWIAEKVEPWTFLKFPYLKGVGWKGLVDGKDSGIYTVAPLGRLNVASGMATPRAQAAYEKYFATLSPDGTPVHGRGATHWARLIELMQGAETVLELARDPEIDLAPRAGRPHGGPHRRRGHRGGAARHADPPLLDRRERHRHPRQPHRGHDQQLRAHRHVRGQGGPQPDLQGHRRDRGPARPHRDGLPGLRPVLRLRHAHDAGPDAHDRHDPRPGRQSVAGAAP